MRTCALCCLSLLAQESLAQEAVRVTVAKAIVRDASHVEFAGKMEPIKSVEIRAPLTSKVAKVLVKPGAPVVRGDPILELDTGPVEVLLRQWDQTLERARNDVKRTQNALETAKRLADLDAKGLADLRTKELRKFQEAGDKARTAWKDLALKNTYWKSQGEFRTARETLEQTLVLFKSRPEGSDPLAQVQRLQQALSRVPAGPVPLDKESAAELAKLTEILRQMVLMCRAGTPLGRDALKAEATLAETVLKTTQDSRDQVSLALNHAKVLAPMDGLAIGLVKAGDAVQAGARSATLLARIIQADTVRVTFAIDEDTYLTLQKMDKREELTPVALAVGQKKNNDFPFPGKIEFVDNRLDPIKGVAVVRALFDNPKGSLTETLVSAPKEPLSVRVRITLGESRQVVLVPRQVVLTNPDGSRQVLVAKEKKLEVRPVKLGGELGGMQIVTQGLAPEDLVIVDLARRDFKDQTLTPADFATDVRLLRSRAGAALEPVLVEFPRVQK
jgi:RND family efflux transporter MFP subunit